MFHCNCVAVLLLTGRALHLQGLRVLGLAIKTVLKPQMDFTVSDERDLVFRGYLAFLDPPKETAAPAMEQMAAAGVQLKVRQPLKNLDSFPLLVALPYCCECECCRRPAAVLDKLCLGLASAQQVGLGQSSFDRMDSSLTCLLHSSAACWQGHLVCHGSWPLQTCFHDLPEAKNCCSYLQPACSTSVVLHLLPYAELCISQGRLS